MTWRFVFLLLLLSPVTAASGQVRDSALVQSGGASLFLELRGADSTRPLVLFLHGGPADPLYGLMAFMAYPGERLEREFLMVYLYQRGTGKSGPVPVGTQTLSQHVEDVRQVVEYLRRRFPHAPLSIIGHSWGGTLGTAYVLEHGPTVDHLVQVAGILSSPRTEREGYRVTLEAARAAGNTNAIRELESIGPPPWASLDHLIIERRWAGRLAGGSGARTDRTRALRAGGYGQSDPAWPGTQMEIVTQLAPEFLRLDLEPRLEQASTPLLLIAGGRDLIVPPVALRPGFDRYGGPKHWVVFEESGHEPFIEDTDRFVTTVSSFLLGRAQ